jgi:hypothetical protein
MFGLAYAIKKGDMKPGDANAKAKELADSMSLADLKKFAETDHENLPDKVKENITLGSIGGMGATSFPGTGASINVKGSGDVSSPSGDAKKHFKKKKKEREEELKKKKNESMLYMSFKNFVNEEYQAFGKYNTVKKVIKELGRRPSEKDVAKFVMQNYKDVTGKEVENSDPTEEDKIADIVAFYKFDTDNWEKAFWYEYQNTPMYEAKIRDAREDLGYVALLKEMSDLNDRDIQSAYNDALDVLQDKGMSEKQAIGFLNSPHGKYMAEYVIPGMDYGHEAFLYKLEEYYNERMLKQYAKDYIGLAK